MKRNPKLHHIQDGQVAVHSPPPLARLARQAHVLVLRLPRHDLETEHPKSGMPDPEAEVIALSPKTRLATNQFVCEICSKGFQRDQNFQLHRRSHNLPWKLRQRSSKEVKK
ncbi:hypothetical protein ACFX11_027936 [Malus domestica]